MKNLRVGNVIACEYVALGSYGKHTIVNALTGGILVNELPAVVPLAFYIELILTPDTPKPIKIEVFQDQILKGTLAASFEYELGDTALLVVPQLLFTLDRKTTIRVAASGDGLKRTTLVSKEIDVGPIPAR